MKKRTIVLSLVAATGTCFWIFTKLSPSAHKTPTHRPPTAELNQAFPSDSRKVLEQSDRFILYSIEPDPEGAPNKTLEDYAIVGQTEITDKKVRSDLIAHFYAGMADQLAAGGRAACFYPHHAIRAVKGKKTVDLIISFMCLSARVDYGKGKGKLHGYAGVSEAPKRFYDAVLENAGVPSSKNSLKQ
jgi:hypothetical protein